MYMYIYIDDYKYIYIEIYPYLSNLSYVIYILYHVLYSMPPV